MKHLFYLCMLFFPFSAWSQKKGVKLDEHFYLSGYFNNLTPQDTLTMYLHECDRYVSETQGLFLPHQKIAITNNSKQFSFKSVSIKKRSYLMLNITGTQLDGPIAWYIVEPGDSIHVRREKSGIQTFLKRDNGELTFSGRGAGRFELLFRLSQIEDSILNKTAYIQNIIRTKANGFSIPQKASYLNAVNLELLTLFLNTLESYKKQLSAESYSLIKLNIESEVLSHFYNSFSESYFDTRNDSVAHRIIRNLFLSLREQMNPDVSNLSMQTRLESFAYSKYLIAKEICDMRFSGEQVSYDSIPLKLSRAHPSPLKESVLASYFPSFFQRMNLSAIAGILSGLQPGFYTDIVRGVFQSSKSGTPAFPFALPDQTGKIVKLDGFRGKVVFIDFWYVGCGACAAYYQQVLKEVEEHYYNNQEIVFVTISIDKEREKWIKRGLESGLYTSDRAINLYTEGLGYYHPMIKHYNISAYPSPMLIGKTGKLVNFDQRVLRKMGTLKQAIDAELKK